MTDFTTDSIFDALRSPLGVIDNPERRKQIEDYIEAARPPLDRAITDLLSRFAEAVDEAVSAHYEVRLNYRPGVLSLDVRPREPSEPPEETWSTEGELEKITLRIPAELKDLAAEAASQANLSANSWFVRMLARALRAAEAADRTEGGWQVHIKHKEKHKHKGGGSRLSGWVGPEE